MKDLFDAVKEAYSQSEPSPAEGGWQKVSASMRRASVLRAIAWGGTSIAACAATALLLFHPSHSVSDPVQVSRTAEVTPSAPVLEVLTEEPVSDPSAPMLSPVQPVSAHRMVAQAHVETEEASLDGDTAEAETEAVEAIGAVETVKAADTASDVQDDSEVQQPERWWEEPVPATKDRRHVKIGVNASASPMSSAVSNVFMPQTVFLAVLKSNSILNNSTASEIQSMYSNFSSMPTSVNYSHDLPVGLGIALNFPLTDRFSVETGLNYTYLHSTENDHGSISDQRLHFAGIPVRAEYSLIRRRAFSLYAGAGTSLEKCLKASIGGRTYSERRLQWSGEAFAGAEYTMWKNTSLYLQPTVSYWFTDTDLITYRTENPLVFSISAGIRLHL